MNNRMIHRFFSDQEVDALKSLYQNAILEREFENNEDCTIFEPTKIIEQRHMGRSVIKFGKDDLENMNFPKEILSRVQNFVNERSEYANKKLNLTGVTFVRYDNVYGVPNVYPHVDLGNTVYIADYHLESNISWPIGVDEDVYHLEDNTILLFDALKEYHWRPNLKFDDGKYLIAVFFEYQNPSLTATEDNDRRERANTIMQLYSNYLAEREKALSC